MTCLICDLQCAKCVWRTVLPSTGNIIKAMKHQMVLSCSDDLQQCHTIQCLITLLWNHCDVSQNVMFYSLT